MAAATRCVGKAARAVRQRLTAKRMDAIGATLQRVIGNPMQLGLRRRNEFGLLFVGGAACSALDLHAK